MKQILIERQAMIQRLEAEKMARDFQAFGLGDSNSNTRVKDPAICHNMSRTAGFNYNSPYNSFVSNNYGSPYYFHGESSTGRPSYCCSCRGFLESPFVDYNHGGSYNLLQDYPPRIPYGGRKQTEKSSGISFKILNIMTREGGSSMFKDLLRDCSSVEKINLIRAITQDREILARAAKDENGIESVKVLIDAVEKSHNLFNWVTLALQEDVFELMMHPTGFKLVLHCLRHLKYEQNYFILSAASKHCFKLARNEKGSVCLKECVLFARYPDQGKILNKIVDNSATLAKNSRGNYVIQFVLDCGFDGFSRAICLVLEYHLEDLSLDQHGSYVIQKCLESSVGEILVRQLVRFDENKLERLATDRYGNYVLQTAIKMSKRSVLGDELVRAIRRLPMDLEDNIYARNVLSSLDLQENDGIEGGSREHSSY